MRVAVLADDHYCESGRWDECVRIHDWIADDIARRGVDLIADAGDIFDRKSSPAERNAVVNWVTRLADHAPVIIVRGNHDVLGDLRFLARLRTAHQVTVEEGCGVYTYQGAGDAVLSVAAVAWPRKAEMLARMEEKLDRDAELEAAGDVLRSVLRGLGQQMTVPGPKMLLMHAMVRGSATSTGQPLVGCDMEVGLEDLALANADFVALGHIHKAQEWKFGGVPIVYPGSPRRTAFGEIEQKAYVIVEFEEVAKGRWSSKWERIVTPATPMLLLVDEWSTPTQADLFGAPSWRVGPGKVVEPADLAGAEVRLRYTVDADQRERARAASDEYEAALMKGGAKSVKVEEMVRPVVRARAPEVARALTLSDKLRACWKARNITLPPEREARLLALSQQLETEAREA